MLKKVLIANRGEIAVRVIRACRDLGLATVAVYSQADASAMHVHLADEAVCIGPPASRESYTHIANILSAAQVTGADSVHPGYGFLAENSSFAEACELHGITFVGPPRAAIELMGDKASARRLMEEHGVPLVPGSREVISLESDAVRDAARIGFPLIIKATAGGGGKGMRIVEVESDLSEAVRLAQAEAGAAFGNPGVYLERYLREPRHVEIQIFGDSHGTIVHLGERDCSVQTERHQKMVEEAPCPVLGEEARRRMGDAAVAAAAAVGYTGAGTVEFLLEGDSFYFMEMNTRIQVEHPVTELVTGVDLVKLQLQVAMGEPLGLSEADRRLKGHAIEVRLTAEDPARNFTPAAGRLTRVRLPGGPGIRVDTHIYEGYEVPPYYDSLLAKVLAWGRDRDEAIGRLQRALRETEIEGVQTTLPLYRLLLTQPEFRAGNVDTHYLQKYVV